MNLWFFKFFSLRYSQLQWQKDYSRKYFEFDIVVLSKKCKEKPTHSFVNVKDLEYYFTPWNCILNDRPELWKKFFLDYDVPSYYNSNGRQLIPKAI